ncbi:MAG: dTMP kinase [Cenarchaeum sp. SB0665_bin_23]|nr:dTMP kinase [Cenarchaeum sp. SB0665_bin_23]MYB46721.1 dTMP kinase [Cenarchaeum sp. SB0662_bin_33]MYG33271.1 dTMP kinase [Cenarchaeum sp. SB0677_bin_16]MYJ27236.1 dTMP kinase [Cenarchaeum sp. SB0672_bin_9]
MIITIEGVDQSGKTIQSNMLASKISKAGVGVTQFSFPDYATPLGQSIQESLAAKTIDTEQIHRLLAENRRERLPEIQQALQRDDTVIMNRYCESNIIYGLANGLDEQWLEDLDSEMPKSDVVIVLHISSSESFRRKNRRDIFEMNTQLMEDVISTYKAHAEQKGWYVIDGAQDPKVVHNDIWDIVKNICTPPKLT